MPKVTARKITASKITARKIAARPVSSGAASRFIPTFSAAGGMYLSTDSAVSADRIVMTIYPDGNGNTGLPTGAPAVTDYEIQTIDFAYAGGTIQEFFKNGTDYFEGSALDLKVYNGSDLVLSSNLNDDLSTAVIPSTGSAGVTLTAQNMTAADSELFTRIGNGWQNAFWPNLLLDSRDLASANWSNQFGVVTANRNATGLDGEPNTATTLTETDATAVTARIQTASIFDDSLDYGVIVYLEKDSDETRFPCVEITLFGGATVSQGVNINTKTGASSAVGIGGSFSVEDAGTFWKVQVAATNNESGNLSGRLRIYPARSDDSVTGSVPAATGSVVVDYTALYKADPIAGRPVVTTDTPGRRLEFA